MPDSRTRLDLESTRRKLLGLLGAGATVSLAGCLGGDDDDDDGDDANGDDANGDDANGDDANGDDNGTADPGELDDLVEGGHLRAGMGANINSFDGPYSTDTSSTLSQSLVFEGFVTSDAEGNLYPWLAEDFDVVDVQDVERMDYEPYMSTFTAGEEGAIDTGGEQEVVRHPEDGLPEEGDDVRTLLFSDAADAVEDGVYGVQIRYHIREGVEFHNGEEMTAADAVASYDRIQLSDISAQYFDSTLYYEEVDEYTVDIYAQVPDAEAERELPVPQVMPVEQAELPPGDLDPRSGNDPIGTGPYEFVEMSDEQFVDYEKFDDYWVEQHGVDSLDWADVP